MKQPKCKYENTKMDLAKYEKSDIGFEDHGFFTIFGGFNYLDAGHQGFGIIINEEFIRNFFSVLGVETISECNNNYAWVEHTQHKIFRIISTDGKIEFDIENWIEETEKKGEKK